MPKDDKDDIIASLRDNQGEGASKEQLQGEIKKLKERIAQLESLQKDRKTDPDYFNERLSEEIARCSRYKYEFCLMYLELDNLGFFSKKQGDEAATEVLQMLDTVLSGTLRTSDLKCQLRRGNYGIILPYTDSNGGRIAAEKVRQTVVRIFMLKSTAVSIPLTVSAGLASYPRDAMSSEHLGEMAKAALSRAQRDGGNVVCLSTSPTDSDGQEKEERTRLSNDTFLLALDSESMRCARFGETFSLMLLAVTSLENKETKIDGDVRAGIMRAVFKLMNANVRNIDKSYLYSDSRFAVVLPNTGPDGALIVAQKLVRSLTSNPVLRNNGVDINISVNAGISTFPTDDITGDGLLRKTDETLCQAIKKGANQIELAADVLSLSCRSGRNIDDLVLKLKEAGAGAVYSLLAAVDVTEHYDHPHSQAVAKYAVATGLAMSLSNIKIRHLRLMALLHDIGKSCIPDGVLTKPGPLDGQEWDLMMKHPQLGSHILQQLPDFAFCCAPILAHHERPDGKGYPKGLKADQIPLESEIIAVAEAYDDMTTQRPYRQQVFPAEAVEELKKQAGAQFNPDVVSAFIKALYSAENKPLK